MDATAIWLTAVLCFCPTEEVAVDEQEVASSTSKASEELERNSIATELDQPEPV